MTFSSNTAKTAPKTIAYLRVSTIDQDIEKNKAAILALANHKVLGHVHFVEEKISGKVSWRKRKIAKILETSKRTTILLSVSNPGFGRSMLECMEIFIIATQKGINVYAVKGDWQLKNNSIQSKIIAMAFSMASEIERDLISKRTREALQVKKQNGMKWGDQKGWGKVNWTFTELKLRRFSRTALPRNLSRSAITQQRQIYTTFSNNVE